jgi:twitching motility protein PilT
MVMDMQNLDINGLLKLMVRSGISDIHFKANAVPLIRIHGKLISSQFTPIPAEFIKNMAYKFMTEPQKKVFEEESELDTAYAVEGLSRFRVNMYKQKGTIALTLRVIPSTLKSFEELNLPAQVLKKLCTESHGLILIAGVTGAGKTTTMNAIIDYINTNVECNIISIEDPIEFYHTDKKASISQREVGLDTKSFKNALKYVLRQDPDVICIGEMRDFEAISAAITAAETGHLVLSTIHTINTVQTIDRIIDTYPSHQQNQVRAQLSNVLKGVIAQRLCRRSDMEGRIPATEVFIGTSLVRKLISENKIQDLYKAIGQGEFYGMHTFDQDLIRLHKEKKISEKEAIDKAQNPEDMVLTMKGMFMEEGAQ